ncbi:hypothetical protein [Arthrobacter celericrescens]|uniref:hypothetical protein n=1 Tax=Arthrobacter celericrescens TaxID=2320851 RepID=UPI000EA18031|nr:hypothetical protein [Arthrobacter celericrescens]
MQPPPRITIEVPLLSLGEGAADFEALGSYVDALRRPRGLHMTLLHVGILEDFAADVAAWTKGFTSADSALERTASWLRGLPVLAGFTASAQRLLVLGGGRVSGLEVEVPQAVRDFQLSLVVALHGLLDDLAVDNIDDFILSSPALGYRSPRWIPHVAVGRPKTRHRRPTDIEPLALEFGASRIRNEWALGGVERIP